jgi:hypothetical protein
MDLHGTEHEQKARNIFCLVEDGNRTVRQTVTRVGVVKPACGPHPARRKFQTATRQHINILRMDPSLFKLHIFCINLYYLYNVAGRKGEISLRKISVLILLYFSNFKHFLNRIISVSLLQVLMRDIN